MKYFCNICDYIWEINSKELPAFCPHCRKTNWEVGDNYNCDICDSTLLTPILHHIDGNHNNNLEENRMFVCLRCHAKIHRGKNLYYNRLLKFYSGKPRIINKDKNKKRFIKYIKNGGKRKFKNFKKYENN